MDGTEAEGSKRAWLSVRQAAESLGVSPSLVYALTSSGKIRHSRIGVGRGHIKISPEAIDEYMENCTIGVRVEKPVQKLPKLRYVKIS